MKSSRFQLDFLCKRKKSMSQQFNSVLRHRERSWGGGKKRKRAVVDRLCRLGMREEVCGERQLGERLDRRSRYCRQCHWRPSVIIVCSVSHSLHSRGRVVDFIPLS